MLTRLVTVRQPLARGLRDELFARVIGPAAPVQRAIAQRVMGLA
jgi:hypothetical protein